MKIATLIARLQALQEKHGNVELVTRLVVRVKPKEKISKRKK